MSVFRCEYLEGPEGALAVGGKADLGGAAAPPTGPKGAPAKTNVIYT